MHTLAPTFPALPWIGWWSRLVNHVRLLGHPRHRRKVKRSRALLLKIASIATQENGHARAFGYLRKADPYLFEELILSVIEQAGVRVIRNRSYSADGGVDGALIYRGRRVQIQAKRYDSHIARGHVATFGQVCLTQGASAGLFVHTGRTGEGVRTLLRDPGVAPVVSLVTSPQLVTAEKAYLDHYAATDPRRDRGTRRSLGAGGACHDFLTIASWPGTSSTATSSFP